MLPAAILIFTYSTERNEALKVDVVRIPVEQRLRHKFCIITRPYTRFPFAQRGGSQRGLARASRPPNQVGNSVRV